MAINKKGSRKITVNGHDFRWRTIGNDKFITLVLWPVKNKNSRVVGRIGYYNNVFPIVQDPITTNEHVKITNRLVREVILHCGVKNIVENEGQLNVGSLEDIENIKKVIMDICSRIRKARGGHDTIVGIKEIEVKFAAQAAEMFNLSSLPSVYHEIENTESISILTSALHNSMVWPDCELMPFSKAEYLAAEFINHFSSEDPKYYTNRGWDKGLGELASEWCPATEATFDTGIIIVAHSRIGCAWFTEED